MHKACCPLQFAFLVSVKSFGISHQSNDNTGMLTSAVWHQAPSAAAEKAPEAPPSALNPNEWKAFKVQNIDTGGPPNTNRYRCDKKPTSCC